MSANCFSFCGDFVPQAPGLHWGTSISQTPWTRALKWKIPVAAVGDKFTWSTIITCGGLTQLTSVLASSQQSVQRTLYFVVLLIASTRYTNEQLQTPTHTAGINQRHIPQSSQTNISAAVTLLNIELREH